MLIAVRPPEAGVMKDSVPDYTLNRNRTISPSSPAEYIPRGPRIEKQPVEVNSAGWQGFVGQNACAAQERRPACGGRDAKKSPHANVQGLRAKLPAPCSDAYKCVNFQFTSLQHEDSTPQKANKIFAFCRRKTQRACPAAKPVGHGASPFCPFCPGYFSS